MRERGVNRVVMAVRDLEAGRVYFESLLGCTFQHADDDEAARFGVQILMSWDGGIELVAPIEGRDSHVQKILDERGEGLIGVVWAVADADASRNAAAELGHPVLRGEQPAEEHPKPKPPKQQNRKVLVQPARRG